MGRRLHLGLGSTVLGRRSLILCVDTCRALGRGGLGSTIGVLGSTIGVLGSTIGVLGRELSLREREYKI
jgi:hypothetical protein